MYEFVSDEATTIMDLGCGMQALRNMLSRHQVYIPVDCIARSDDTIVCDFNKGEFPQQNGDVCLISGCLEYIHNWKCFLNAVARSCTQICLSYATAELTRNRNMLWVNSIPEIELIRFVVDCGFELADNNRYLGGRLFNFISRKELRRKMQYRMFGRTGKMISLVGMGANRFRPEDVGTPEGIGRCAELVVRAASMGVNFFDSAAAYSDGRCEEILRHALPAIRGTRYICGKSSSHQEKTRDAVLRHIERSLMNIGIDHFDFYYMWSIKSLAQYEEIMAPGGPYEGVIAARDRGLLGHICFSSHASASDAVRIIQDGAFEGILVSYSLMNFRENDVVLDAARAKGMGVAVMNPLGGGIIPQNASMFDAAIMDGDTGISDAALKFIHANPAVSTVLCGVETERELTANVWSLSKRDANIGLRRAFVNNALDAFPGFCTGCGYCVGCPAGIPIPVLLSAYNKTKFAASAGIYNRRSPEIIKRTNFFRAIEGKIVFEHDRNPCVRCGKCEKICTNNLSIMDTLAEIYEWIAESCVSSAARKERLHSLVRDDCRHVGLYTAGGDTAFVLALLKREFANSAFEIFVFDSNPLRWGQTYVGGLVVKSPDEIPVLDLDVLLISNYVHSDEIYAALTARFPDVPVRKLHADNDVPWVF